MSFTQGSNRSSHGPRELATSGYVIAHASRMASPKRPANSEFSYWFQRQVVTSLSSVISSLLDAFKKIFVLHELCNPSRLARNVLWPWLSS